MSLTRFKKKSVCGFLIFVFLLQSCTVYQKTPVSISEARATNNKVVITKTDFTKHKFRKIEEIDGHYFGIIEANGNLVKVPISESDIITIQIIDRTASTWGTIGIVAGSSLIVAMIIGGISAMQHDWNDVFVPSYSNAK